MATKKGHINAFNLWFGWRQIRSTPDALHCFFDRFVWMNIREVKWKECWGKESLRKQCNEVRSNNGRTWTNEQKGKRRRAEKYIKVKRSSIGIDGKYVKENIHWRHLLVMITKVRPPRLARRLLFLFLLTSTIGCARTVTEEDAPGSISRLWMNWQRGWASGSLLCVVFPPWPPVLPVSIEQWYCAPSLFFSFWQLSSHLSEINSAKLSFVSSLFAAFSKRGRDSEGMMRALNMSKKNEAFYFLTTLGCDQSSCIDDNDNLPFVCSLSAPFLCVSPCLFPCPPF